MSARQKGRGKAREKVSARVSIRFIKCGWAGLEGRHEADERGRHGRGTSRVSRKLLHGREVAMHNDVGKDVVECPYPFGNVDRKRTATVHLDPRPLGLPATY